MEKCGATMRNAPEKWLTNTDAAATKGGQAPTGGA